ncbi:hypothetical protein ACFVUS_37125 [Nocardia sp. NPDC058058]|uniref:hypothetical protein n=1 Tax=Nocardia sp. NPDC058058 TaxID=3346317 RepID=UPI0036DCA833
MITPGLYVTHLLVPKHGSTMGECEDAVCVLPATPFDELIEDAVAVSVCDGATESMLSKDWAQLLAALSAQRALDDPGFFDSGPVFETFAAEAVNAWEPWLTEYTARRASDGRPLQWYEHKKLEEGSALATLLSVRLTPAAPVEQEFDWNWQAAALGDTCLFHIRDDLPIRSFPVQHADEFGTTPNLFGSRNFDAALLSARTMFAAGGCRAGDRLLLMSDALAHWFLTSKDPVSALYELLEFGGPHDTPGFEDWIESLRARGELKNDDVALIRIDVEGR